MTLITPEERVSQTAELLQSLQNSIRELRQMAQDLKRQLENGEEADITGSSRQVAQTVGLIRSCQKVEECFVEQQHRQAGIARGGYALDLVQARFEIGCRLGRLRRCHGGGRVPE
ncbi:hypothetical protein C6Y53_12920 [Pukyongiella litopenaei]|uniref:Uncharacterized protein n=1 Tax=Pukyongiella litopenaei TaxID=2605946 RepID=A0A2S0MRX9_9RHOB|nr:hypothetical protein C6Y53_12920 [Pukyongiella litopenaei]